MSQVWKDRRLWGCLSSCWCSSSWFLSLERLTRGYREIPAFIPSGKLLLLPKHNKDNANPSEEETWAGKTRAVSLPVYSSQSCPSAHLSLTRPIVSGPSALGVDSDWSQPSAHISPLITSVGPGGSRWSKLTYTDLEEWLFPHSWETGSLPSTDLFPSQNVDKKICWPLLLLATMRKPNMKKKGYTEKSRAKRTTTNKL